jgi:hypothetical protein
VNPRWLQGDPSSRPPEGLASGSLSPVLVVHCDTSWESIRELNSYVAKYLGRKLARTPAERGCLVVGELLDMGVAVARAESDVVYELQLRPSDLYAFSMSIATSMVPERSRLLGTRVHKLMQIPHEEACRTILGLVARGKEDESCLPLARIRSEGMDLSCREFGGQVTITASTLP